jgi:hypothetical protein
MVERLVLALVVLAPAVASAGAPPMSAAAVTAPADSPPAPVPEVEPAPSAIALAPPSMVAPREPAASPPATSSQWYGWQILISDAAVFSFAGFTGNASIAYGWVGSGAVVHFGHGNVGRGVASAALRVSLPLLGLYAGIAGASGCHGDWCGVGEALAGGLIGMGSAELIDIVLLARDSAPAPAAVRPASRSHGIEVSPVVRAGRSGFGLDVVGRF